MNKKIENAFNKQINAELYSSYLYLAMSAWLESKNFKGMAHWMRAQAAEEQAHALKFYDFIHDRQGRVKLAAIDEPPAEWISPAAVFKDAYEHECKVSALIHGLVDLAAAEKDHAASSFLQWFVNEQVEEEAHASEIAEKLNMIGDSRGPIFMIDSELGKRGN